MIPNNPDVQRADKFLRGNQAMRAGRLLNIRGTALDRTAERFGDAYPRLPPCPPCWLSGARSASPGRSPLISDNAHRDKGRTRSIFWPTTAVVTYVTEALLKFESAEGLR